MNAKAADRISVAWGDILDALGYDRSDPHLAGSSERVARFFLEWHSGGEQAPSLRDFENGERYDEVVLVRDLPFYSLCAHHGLPFFGVAAVAYLPGDRIVGLSKLARTVQHFARRFQTQERLTLQIADHIDSCLRPIGVAVVLEAEHLCMSMRGASVPGHRTTTSDVRGAFRTKPEARAEVLALIRGGGR